MKTLFSFIAATVLVNLAWAQQHPQGMQLPLPDQEVLSLTVTTTSPESCPGKFDGSAEIATRGGVPPYQYQWSTGATTAQIAGVTHGEYQVTVTDRQKHQGVLTVTVENGSSLHLDTYVATKNACKPGAKAEAGAMVSGGTAPYEYHWSDGTQKEKAKGLAPGDHSVVVVDASGCFVRGAVHVEATESLTAQVVVDQYVSCFHCADGRISALIGGGKAPYSYRWSTGATLDKIAGVNQGDYELVVTDANGCSATADLVLTQEHATRPANATQPSAELVETQAAPEVVVYPNPSQGMVYLALEAGHQMERLEVRDITGKLIRSESVKPEQTTLDLNLENLDNGVYFLHLSGESGQITHKVILH